MKRLLNANKINFACHHLHIDKSKTISPLLLRESHVHMQEKWYLMKNIKEKYTKEELEKRMVETTTNIVNQGCTKMRTFIDIDNTIKLDALNIALELKYYWKKNNVELQLGTQLLEGLETKENIKLFNEAAPLVDFIGCLPSRDKCPETHLDIVFSKAKELNKPVEAHLDQLNIPTEKETELFCDFVEKYNYQGKARAIHCVSLSCHPLEYQTKIAKRLHDLNIGVIICPSAAISMTQHTEYDAPIHNSIAPVKVLIDNNVNVALGIDNIEDIFMPFCDGNLEFELRLLAESTRIYNPDTLMKIATNTMGFTDNETNNHTNNHTNKNTRNSNKIIKQIKSNSFPPYDYPYIH
jgi:cytosine deaminase